MKILVVEDDPFSLKLVVTILAKNGYEVKPATTAQAALRILAKDPEFDLIVSDVMMPNIDGFTFLRQLRIDKRLSRIPVILCTALGDQESIITGKNLGIVDYVIKPIRESVLVAKIKAVLDSDHVVLLVVDDESLMRDLLVRVLNRDGWHAVSAQNGKEALDVVKKNNIQLVLSDIGMPEMDGFELLTQLKNFRPDMPVILVSGREKYSLDDCITAGADDFIAKPFLNTEILAVVDAYLRQFRR
jgi:DNA-binding response OmpR family regulator